jgi:hypothetical protein
MTLNVATFAPIPRASMRTTSPVNPGARLNTESVLEILKEIRKPGDTARVAALLFRILQSPEIKASTLPGLIDAHTRLHMLSRLQLDVSADLFL